MPEGSRENMKSLGKVMRILDAFSTLRRTATVTEVAEQTGFPKSTTHRLLASMRDHGLLDQPEQGEGYRLGMKLFELGNTVLANMELHREARPHVDALARQGGQTVHLAVFDGYRAIVIHRADALPERAFSPTTIEQAPTHCTSVGKAILAFQSAATVQRIVSAGLKRFTENTITDPQALLDALAEIRDRGYALDENEHQLGLRCVGAPIRNQAGAVVAGISLTGPSWKLSTAELDSLALIVIHHADAISAALGFDTPSIPLASASVAR